MEAIALTAGGGGGGEGAELAAANDIASQDEHDDQFAAVQTAKVCVHRDLNGLQRLPCRHTTSIQVQHESVCYITGMTRSIDKHASLI